MNHRFDLLRGGGRDLPERHQTLRAAIDWSYQLLSNPEQYLLRRLSVYLFPNVENMRSHSALAVGLERYFLARCCKPGRASSFTRKICRERCYSMRLLHSRHDHHRSCAVVRGAGLRCRSGARGALGKSLPMHWLRQDRRRCAPHGRRGLIASTSTSIGCTLSTDRRFRKPLAASTNIEGRHELGTIHHLCSHRQR